VEAAGAGQRLEWGHLRAASGHRPPPLLRPSAGGGGGPSCGAARGSPGGPVRPPRLAHSRVAGRAFDVVREAFGHDLARAKPRVRPCARLSPKTTNASREANGAHLAESCPQYGSFPRSCPAAPRNHPPHSAPVPTAPPESRRRSRAAALRNSPAGRPRREPVRAGRRWRVRPGTASASKPACAQMGRFCAGCSACPKVGRARLRPRLAAVPILGCFRGVASDSLRVDARLERLRHGGPDRGRADRRKCKNCLLRRRMRNPSDDGPH
jgi:hypothetical protein